jgi:hypothetical protein
VEKSTYLAQNFRHFWDFLKSAQWANLVTLPLSQGVDVEKEEIFFGNLEMGEEATSDRQTRLK